MIPMMRRPLRPTLPPRRGRRGDGVQGRRPSPPGRRPRRRRRRPERGFPGRPPHCRRAAPIPRADPGGPPSTARPDRPSSASRAASAGPSPPHRPGAQTLRAPWSRGRSTSCCALRSGSARPDRHRRSPAPWSGGAPPIPARTGRPAPAECERCTRSRRSTGSRRRAAGRPRAQRAHPAGSTRRRRCGSDGRPPGPRGGGAPGEDRGECADGSWGARCRRSTRPWRRAAPVRPGMPQRLGRAPPGRSQWGSCRHP